MVIAAAISSCTKENVIDGSNEGENSSLNPNAPIEIKLGATNEVSTTVTRAAIDAWSNTKIGVFALSTSGDWNTNGADGNPNTLWKNVDGTVAADGKVSVALNGQPGYYPNNGTSNYSFYGYCLKHQKSINFSKYGLIFISAIKNIVVFFILSGLLGIDVIKEGLEIYQGIINVIPFLQGILNPIVMFVVLWILMIICESYIIRVYSGLLIVKMMKRK